MNGAGSGAGVILSFDFEIGWGDVSNPMWRVRERNGVYKRLRDVLPRILDRMDRLAIPATWATVGAMVEDPHQRDFSYLPEQWRNCVERVLGEAEPPSFNGADLFEMVLNAKAGHRIGCHSYAHIPYTYSGMTAEVVRQDLARHRAVIARHGLVADRFVFPENREAHHAVLEEAGFHTIRVAAENMFKNRWAYLASTLVVPPPLSRDEALSAAMAKQYGSMLFYHAGSDFRLAVLRRRARLGLNHAMKGNGVLHVWAHPFNFAESTGLEAAFGAFLDAAARLRDAGRITFRLM